MCAYDYLVVPLLCQMINLEELKLYVLAFRHGWNYIDGNQLHDDFLVYMAQLKKFTFNIKTRLRIGDADVKLQSDEDIQRSFVERNYPEVCSYICNRLDATWDGENHIYSLPYDFEYYTDLNNSFPGGIFHKVRQLEMVDHFYFEFKFFELISQSFPFVECLHLSNNRPLKLNQHCPLIVLTFPYLTFLEVEEAHVEYAKLFLFEKITHLPRLSHLSIKHKSLITITNNFTIDAKYFNFSKIKSLKVDGSFVRPKNFHEYFPLL